MTLLASAAPPIMDAIARPAVPAVIGPLRLAAHYRTGDAQAHVGGDWFDAIGRASGALLVVGDVQGHDGHAAILMDRLRAACRAAAAGGHGPATVLTQAHRELVRVDAERIVTALALEVHAPSGIVSVASAGHLPPLAVRPGAEARSFELEPDPPLGIGTCWHETQYALGKDTAVLLYTDGLVEARGWPIDHGIDLLHDALSHLPAGTALGAVVDAALGIIPSGSRDDDVAVLAASTGLSER